MSDAEFAYKAQIVCGCLAILASVALVITIVVVAVHFISKVW